MVDLFNQNLKKPHRLCLVPGCEQYPLPFLLAIGLWQSPVSSGFVLLALVSLGRFLRKEGGNHMQLHHFSCSSDRFPPWFVSHWRSARLWALRPLPKPRRLSGGSDLFLLCTWKAGLCLCKYQAISEQSKKSKQKQQMKLEHLINSGGRARAEGDKGTRVLLWGPRCVLSQMFFSIQAMLISPACRWAEISVNVNTSGRHRSGGHSDGTY